MKKASILASVIIIPKPKHPFANRVNKTEIEALLRYHLTNDDDDNIEDDPISEESIKKHKKMIPS